MRPSRTAGMQDSAIDFKTNGPLGRTTSYVPSLGGARAEGTGELLLERTKTLQVTPLHTFNTKEFQAEIPVHGMSWRDACTVLAQ